jgi:hypothetical protein
MALVRRMTVVGQSALNGALGKAITSNGNGTGIATATAGGGEAPAAPAAPSSAGGWINDAEAAAVASKGAGVGTVLVSFIVVAIGAAAAFALNRWGNHATVFEIGSSTSTYAGLLVFAGAVERVLEPFSGWLPGAHAKNDYEKSVAALANGNPQANLRAVAEAKARLDHAESNRTVLMWGLATAVSTVAAAAGGFYLLHMIAATGWTGNIPDWVDALITGLVVGTGTKPLHDLITRAQDGKGQNGASA